MSKIIIFMVISLFAGVLSGCLTNYVCKYLLRSNHEVFCYNIIQLLVCTVLFGSKTLGTSFSLFTILLGAAFGLITGLQMFFSMRALANGPMHFSNLIFSSSMIIPSLAGVFFGENISVMKLLFIAALLCSISLILKRDENEGAVNVKWMKYCLAAFCLQGMVGITQKVQQNSSHSEELYGFLFVTFLAATASYVLLLGVDRKKVSISKKSMIIAGICGVCSFATNLLNLQLSGSLPGQIFFPVNNGSSIILSTIAAIVIFKDRVTKKQMIGMIGGITALICICLV